MKIVVVEPKKAPYVKEIDGSLESMQKVVGGYIELYMPRNFPDTFCLVCNEEGRLLGLEPCRYIPMETTIYGTFFIVGLSDETDDFVGLTDGEAEIFKYMF